MAKIKAMLPDTTKLNYTTVDGVPTITIDASLTTRAQVHALVDQLEKLSGVLPEAKVIRKIVKKVVTARAARATNSDKEELFGKAHD